MLRILKSRQLHSRLVPFQLVSASTPSISANIGNADVRALTRTAGKIQQVTLREPSRQNVVWIGSQINNTGGFVCDVGGVTPGAIQAKIEDSSGTISDGTANYLAFATDSVTIDSIRSQRTLCSINRPRAIWCKIASAGTVSIGKTDFSVSKTSTGVYVITYKKAFGRTALAFATPIGAAYMGVKITNQSALGCTVSIAEGTPTATDNDFYFLAIGTDSTHEAGRVKDEILNSQRRPRIEAIQYTVTSGTPTISFGTKTATLVDTGTGDSTITLSTPFRREFAAFVTAGTAGATPLQGVIAVANTSAVLEVQTYTRGNVITDPTLGSNVNIIVIGSDELTEF